MGGIVVANEMGAHSDKQAIGPALAAGLLFGLSTPAGKALLAATSPWTLAGLLYLGSAVGLGCVRLIGVLLGRVTHEAPLRGFDWPWFAGAILAGGVLGPVLLMFGLAVGTASQAALLLNLEGVLTAVLAWFVFREHFDKRIAGGMALITAGALLLAWPGAGPGFDSAPSSWSALAWRGPWTTI